MINILDSLCQESVSKYLVGWTLGKGKCVLYKKAWLKSTWSQRSVRSLRDLPWTWNRPLRIARRPHVTALFPADSFWSHRQFPHQEVMRSFIFDLPERWFVYFLDVFLSKWRRLKKRSSLQGNRIGTEGKKQQFFGDQSLIGTVDYYLSSYMNNYPPCVPSFVTFIIILISRWFNWIEEPRQLCLGPVNRSVQQPHNKCCWRKKSSQLTVASQGRLKEIVLPWIGRILQPLFTAIVSNT